MKKNDLIKTDSGIFRVLSVGDNVLAIDSEKKTMPQFFSFDFFIMNIQYYHLLRLIFCNKKSRPYFYFRSE